MASDNISSWVQKKKAAAKADDMSGVPNDTIIVIRRASTKSAGTVIMEIADKLMPWLTEAYRGQHDNNGMLIQPAHIKGLALDAAQRMYKAQQTKASA